ncbi:MAG: hypothetical protein ACFFB5_11760 [Promethearchaeota archaeon]
MSEGEKTAQEKLYTRIMKDIEELKTIQLTTLEAITTLTGCKGNNRSLWMR